MGIEGLLERVGFVSWNQAARRTVYSEIERAGGVDLLVAHAERLRSEGDPSAAVFESWSDQGSRDLIMLRFGLERKPLQYGFIWWRSKGVGIEASLRGGCVVPSAVSPRKVRFTGVLSWDNIDLVGSDQDRLRRMEPYFDLADLARIQAAPRANIEEQIEVAFKLAEQIDDFRYGQGTGGDHKIRTSSNFRLIY